VPQAANANQLTDMWHYQINVKLSVNSIYNSPLLGHSWADCSEATGGVWRAIYHVPAKRDRKLAGRMAGVEDRLSK
jgi:hypothetical protein